MRGDVGVDEDGAAETLGTGLWKFGVRVTSIDPETNERNRDSFKKMLRKKGMELGQIEKVEPSTAAKEANDS
jgi:hypothetical protein